MWILWKCKCFIQKAFVHKTYCETHIQNTIILQKVCSIKQILMYNITLMWTHFVLRCTTRAERCRDSKCFCWLEKHKHGSHRGSGSDSHVMFFFNQLIFAQSCFLCVQITKTFGPRMSCNNVSNQVLLF